MRRILQLLTLIFFFSCGQQDRDVSSKWNKPSHNLDSVAKEDSLKKNVPTQVAKKIEPKLSVPDDIFLDTVKTFDSSEALRIQIVLPKSKDRQLYSANRLLTTIINQEKNKFIKSVSNMLKNDPTMLSSAVGNEFNVYPEELYKDNMLLSYLFVIDIYHAGAPHSKSDYYAFNYDINRQKQIKFSDYFNFKNQKDKDTLLDLINSIFNDQFVKAAKFYAFDFNFNKEIITFNFDDYEIASYAYGMQRAPIDKKTLLSYIKLPYKK